MRKLILMLMVGAAPLAAQSVVTLGPQQCVWHRGDNRAWAAPGFDDSAWQSYSTWKFNLHTQHIWVRCHTSLAPLRTLDHPALQVHLLAASQVFVNGELAGSRGDMESGQFSLDDFYIVQLAPSALTTSSTLALRIVFRDVVQTAPAEILLGDKPALKDHRDAAALAGALDFLPIALSFSLIGVVGFMLLGLYVTDRKRLELLALAIICWLLCDLRLSELCISALAPIPFRLYSFSYSFGQWLEVFWVWFVFRVASKRVPLFYRFIIPFTLWWFFSAQAGAFLSASGNMAFQTIEAVVSRYIFFAAIVCTTAPLVAFWPLNRVPRERRAIAFFCIAWGAADCLRFVTYEFNIFGLINDTHIVVLENQILYLRAATTLCSILALLTILFRDQRRIAQERAALAGEMEAAREIQQYLIPEKMPLTPGLTIRSVYHPSREVGGDFFQVLPDSRDGSTLIVVGDVAGKGLKAGMLSALIVGSIRTSFKFTSDPSKILALLNERLQGRGLVTCMAMRIDLNGNAAIANAGHLPPYVNGKEFILDGALPLGALPDLTFPSQRLQLDAGDAMLFVSDGVIEARNAEGELFGFERTAAISGKSPDQIAQAAQTFGQEDDITVLTLIFAGAEVMHA